MNYKKFYTALGDLLYAIASSDRKVQQAEVEEIRRIVSRELIPLETTVDEYGTDAAYFAEFEFDVLRNTGLAPADAFDRFRDYLREHRDLPQPLKNLSYRCAERVSEAFSGTNAEERELLRDLKKLLTPGE